jgi:hypothetical protein
VKIRVLISFYLAIALIIGSVSICKAQYGGYDDDQRRGPYDNRGKPQYPYEGFSGKKYQYDLSDPADRLEYQVDPDAQLRDKINPDPLIPMDRDMGQYGGGAED